MGCNVMSASISGPMRCPAVAVHPAVSPSSLPTSPVPRPVPQSTPEALPYPILRRLSSTSQSRAVAR